MYGSCVLSSLLSYITLVAQLLGVNGAPVADFVTLEAALDDAVGGSVLLTVARGGADVNVTVPVADLHRVTPSSFLEVGNAVLHDLSYHTALAYNLPLHAGVYVADPVGPVRGFFKT